MFKGKNVIITGASRGIGQTITENFLQEGARVFGIDLAESKDKETLSQLAKENNTEIIWKFGDVSNEETVVRIVSEIIEEAGSIDVLINNAGITKDGLLMRMSKADWDAVMNVNLTGAFLFSREVIRPMMKQRSGAIVNMSSVVGVHGNGGQCNYSASKAGLLGLTKSLAKEVASRNIRVNAIAPGFVVTEMTDKLPEKVKEDLNANIPLKRLGSVDDIANAVIFLSSDKAAYITGQVLGVDGGMGI